MTIAAVLELPPLAAASDDALLTTQRSLAEVRRQVDAAASRVADEIARRSRPELGYDGLAQRLGARTPAHLVQRITGTSAREAGTLVRAGAMQTGRGIARFEGQSAPISVDTAARMVCEVGVLPVLFEGGQVINLGREQRLYTRRQTLALAARDGGCTFPECERPPSWTEAHHINEWRRDRGGTDIADGVLLCRHHHLLVHNNGWRVTRDGADYAFVPPPELDARQRPISAQRRALMARAS